MLSSVAPWRIYVPIDDDVALGGLDDERNDLVGETPGLLGRLRLVLRGKRELILLLTRQLELAVNVLGGDKASVRPSLIIGRSTSCRPSWHLGTIA